MVLKIQTPSGKLIDEEVKSVICPTESGEIQVLPQHQDLLSKLKVGVVVAVTAGGEKRSFLLNSGLIRVEKEVIEITSVDGYELVGKKSPLENYKAKMTEKSKHIDEAIRGALNNREYYIQSYLFEEERLAKFELLQELLKGD